MKILSEQLSEKKYLFSTIGILMIFIIVTAFINSRQNDPIVGTWIGLHSTDTTGRWVFTSNNKFKEYYHNKLDEEYTYKLSKTPNPCGVDMSKRLQMYPEEQILILTDTETNKKRCSLVYKLTNNRLILAALTKAHIEIDTLKKVQQ